MKRDISGRWLKIQQRFGIAAPRVAVYSHTPWYWRWLWLAVLLAISAVAAKWVYDAGRRFAGFDQSEVESELAVTKRDLAAAQAELERLRAIANAAENRLSIERTAQQKLAQQIRTLEQDNAKVREDLATFESMISSDARSGNTLAIYRFKVEPDVLPGEYRYHLLLVTPRARREREFTGRLELVVTLTNGGQNAMISFPEPGDAGASEFRLAFKYFRRVEGIFRINPKAKVENVQVRVYETGSNQPRATLTVTLGA
ncbi:MAG TPA: DUF6776 family protein [Burkholderiales bacterium]|nr:DUF6776 family protein [Burkholderiales bacterium]